MYIYSLERNALHESIIWICYKLLIFLFFVKQIFPYRQL